MRRTPINRATPGALAWQRKKRKTLARVSAKGRVQRVLWQEEKAAHLEVEPNCQHVALGIPIERCWGPLDVHHCRPRGMGGRRGPAGKKVTLCRAAHDWVETNRQLAREMGLLLRPRDVENEG